MIGLAPASRFFIPSLTIACARTVAVVVPSPATSLVLVATSFTSCAPIFSKASSSSISLAMVTPSLVIRGAPKDLSSTTFLPFGPKVTLTVSANLSTPASRAFLASDPYFNSFAMIIYLLFLPIICYSTIANISLCFTMIYSSPSSFTSVPAYLE